MKRRFFKIWGLPQDWHLRIMLMVHLVWLGILCLLGAWWGQLVLLQARKIAELETELGLASPLAEIHWNKTHRMLVWESATFFALLLACSSVLFWLYWRDVKRAKGIQAFFASVTHELRTPLTSIRLQAESLGEDLEGNAGRNKWVQRLLEDCIRLEGKVEKTLELSRIEGGGPVYPHPVPIKPWLGRFLKTWCEDHRDRVDLEVHVEDILIEADPSAIQVILRNLLDNSLRHSKKERVRIQIRVRIQEDGVILMVQDDGKGFSGNRATLGKIFQKGSGSSGTGVGLYLVKTLMKRMGGAASFSFSECQTGGGSKAGFCVSLWFPEGHLHA